MKSVIPQTLPKEVSFVMLLSRPGDLELVSRILALQVLAKQDLSAAVPALVEPARTLSLPIAAEEVDESIDFGNAFQSADHLKACFPSCQVEGKTGTRFKVRFEKGVAVKAVPIAGGTVPSSKSIVALSTEQMMVVKAGLSKPSNTPVSFVAGPRGVGKTTIAAQLIASFLVARPVDHRILVVCPTLAHLEGLFSVLKRREDVDASLLCVLGVSGSEFSPKAIAKQAEQDTIQVLKVVKDLAGLLYVPDVEAACATCDSALWFLNQVKGSRALNTPGVAELLSPKGGAKNAEEDLVALIRRVQHLQVCLLFFVRRER